MKNTFGLGFVTKEARSKPKGGKRKREENNNQEDNSQKESEETKNNKRVKVKEEVENENIESEKSELSDDAGMTDNKLKQLLSEDKLMQFTAKQLKQMCIDREIPCKASAKKAIIALLQNYIDNLMEE